jgi:hypothetical protein
MKFTVKTPVEASLWMLREAEGVDTVVLAQLCDIKSGLSDAFKKGLVAWVAHGHKLIIQDADKCDARHAPDYGFLPYRFATSNPGAKGAKGDQLIFVEENTIANLKPEDPAFLDVESWLAGTKGNHNELGDSNTVKAYAPQWCGHLFGTNVLKVNGFMEAYAHHGRGLIIYDGFDIDQRSTPVYRQLVTRELAQPFDPDNLPCSARLGDFVISTDQRLKSQPMAPGHIYTYPLTLLSNQGYRGTIKLTLTTTPPEPTFTYTFEPETVVLTDIAPSTLTVTTTAASPPSEHALAEATGGRYYSAQNGEALARALLIASIGKMPYAIFDNTGRQIAKGDTETAARELVPGEYRVVVTAGEQELVAQPVRVAAGNDTLLKVVLKGDRFALEARKGEQ